MQVGWNPIFRWWLKSPSNMCSCTWIIWILHTYIYVYTVYIYIRYIYIYINTCHAYVYIYIYIHVHLGILEVFLHWIPLCSLHPYKSTRNSWLNGCKQLHSQRWWMVDWASSGPTLQDFFCFGMDKGSTILPFLECHTTIKNKWDV